tara:strand:- start:5 stop:310 length:306 start_codon:yes stop_codon:yes gene_type:complete
LAKKRRLSKADKQKRENFKWIIMFSLIVFTIAVYLASFVEVDKTQSTIDFNKKTLAKLDEELKIKKNAVERLKRADIISKKGKEVGLVPSKAETIIVKVYD